MRQMESIEMSNMTDLEWQWEWNGLKSSSDEGIVILGINSLFQTWNGVAELIPVFEELSDL